MSVMCKYLVRVKLEVSDSTLVFSVDKVRRPVNGNLNHFRSLASFTAVDTILH